jgi:hypothetical protein
MTGEEQEKKMAKARITKRALQRLAIVSSRGSFDLDWLDLPKATVERLIEVGLIEPRPRIGATWTHMGDWVACRNIRKLAGLGA